MKLVRVAPGYSSVPLLGQFWNQGQLIKLSDSQYQVLPPVITLQLVVVSSGPDEPGSGQTRPSTSSYTEQLVASELVRLGVPIFLVWDGASYQPESLKTTVSRPKTFIGPTDPHTLSGVILAPRDQWIDH